MPHPDLTIGTTSCDGSRRHLLPPPTPCSISSPASSLPVPNTPAFDLLCMEAIPGEIFGFTMDCRSVWPLQTTNCFPTPLEVPSDVAQSGCCLTLDSHGVRRNPICGIEFMVSSFKSTVTACSEFHRWVYVALQ